MITRRLRSHQPRPQQDHLNHARPLRPAHRTKCGCLTSPVVGYTYPVTAKGGGSGNPVTFAIDGQSSSVCSVSGAIVTFNQSGTCVIDANQAGNGQYLPAPQAQQTIAVKQSQTISFTSKAPVIVFQQATYTVAATATSGGTVSFSSGSLDVCTVSGTTVTFNQPGTCVIDANQAGNDQYLPAPQVQQQVLVNAPIP